jgi:histidinol-phosphate aminotransferase
MTDKSKTPGETAPGATVSQTPFVHSPFVRADKAYAPPPYPAPIDLYLDGNEGIAIAPELLKEIGALDVEIVRRYPKNRPLEQLLATRFDLPREQVLVTAGADDALERIIRATVSPGTEALMPVPTFEMIERYVLLAGGHVNPVLWLEGALPLDALLAKINVRTSLITIVSPNSPTGLTVSIDAIGAISAAAPDRLILVDLAYVEFADRDITADVLQLPNTVVTRTLSKAYGIAGARVGYALGSAEAIALMRAAGHPYAVSSISIALAMRRLESGQDEMTRWVARVRKERAELIDMLRSRGVSAGPSEGNFIFVTHPDAAGIRHGLALRGIGVRGFPGIHHLENSLRITLPGEPEAFKRLYDGLQNLT